jgi:hypothetical protein
LAREDFVKNADDYMPKAVESWPKVKGELEHAKYR